MNEEITYLKQVIVVRKDLGMRKGKMIAQGAHASIGAAEHALDRNYDFWHMMGQTKIVVGIEGSESLLNLYKKVNDAGIPAKLVRDEGRTELESGTITAVGIGPAEADEIDEYTGELDLL